MNVYILETKDSTMTNLYKQVGVDFNKAYPMLGFGGDKILVQVEDRLLDIYPSKVKVAL